MTSSDSIPQAHSDAAIGATVRAELGDRRPWVAVQTTFSALHGTVSPARWATALGALVGEDAILADRRGANHVADGAAVARTARASAAVLAGAAPATPAPKPMTAARGSTPWAALADHGDLAGVPACLAAWGQGRVAMGALLPICDEGSVASPLLVLAPDENAYRRLCVLLSWHNEEPTAWQAWRAGLSHTSPAWDGLVVLVQDAQWADRLTWHGAEAWWRLPGPSPLSGFPSAAVPILTDITASGARASGLLHLIQDRSQVHAHIEAVRGRIDACTLEQLPRLMAGVDEAAIARGHDLAARCHFSPGQPGADGQPLWQMPPNLWDDPGRELRRRCLAGIHQRYGMAPPAIIERLDRELGIIMRKGFASYILTVQALARGRRTCGRGSAASSLVCYLLGLTNVDPVKYRLVFERFLSDERTDPPDIDIDFAWDERDEVFAWAFTEYGRDHVAMVATHQTLRSDGALREAGRILGHERIQLTALRRRMALTERFGVGEDAGSAWDEVSAAAGEIAGALRGFGLHCGGMVITTRPIREFVPVHPAAKTIAGIAVPAIAWEKDGAEAMGLVKIDILGNRSLAVVRDVMQDLREDGVAVDEWRWFPDEDLLAKQLIKRGDTIGCFYIESPAMRLLNAKAGDVDYDRLVLHSSIVRPAAYHWIGIYLQRLQEFRRTGCHQEAWYPHPALRELLSEGFGVLSYQEDVMLVARDMAGFDQRHQDRLRKALGRSDTPQRLAALANAFFSGCAARGASPEATNTVWSMIVSFAGYSFCKAHSASYAMVSFACACLKAHNPAHFLARVIHHAGGFYDTCAYIEEARRRGVAILPPCVIDGFPDTRREGHGAIRIGLESIHGLRRATQHAIVAARQCRPFAGIRDLFMRCRARASELAMLLDAGALDRLTPAHSPAQRLWIVQQVSAEPRGEEQQEGQLRFDFTPLCSVDPPPPSDLPAQTQLHCDRRAWNALGFLPRAHPFVLWNLPMRRLFCRDIGPRLAGRTVTLLVWAITHKQVEAVQERGRDGKLLPDVLIRHMAFVTLEDETGLVEATWFPECYRSCGVFIEERLPFWVQGRIAVDFGVATLEVTSAWAAVQAVPARPLQPVHTGSMRG